jgi:hypothetical protein
LLILGRGPVALIETLRARNGLCAAGSKPELRSPGPELCGAARASAKPRTASLSRDLSSRNPGCAGRTDLDHAGRIATTSPTRPDALGAIEHDNVFNEEQGATGAEDG